MSAFSHRYHPDPAKGDPEDAVLWDDCDACTDNGKRPEEALDAATFAELWYQATGLGSERKLTDTEFDAVAMLEKAIRINHSAWMLGLLD